MSSGLTITPEGEWCPIGHLEEADKILKRKAKQYEPYIAKVENAKTARAKCRLWYFVLHSHSTKIFSSDTWCVSSVLEQF